MEYSYTYDNDYYTMVTRMVDAFGYSSSTEYDKLWNAPLVTTDLNGEKMEYIYDDAGRQVTFCAPYEIVNKQPFSVCYDCLPANRSVHTMSISGNNLNFQLEF